MVKDYCIICGVETPYDCKTHIDMRLGYVEGVGQLCAKCWAEDNDKNILTIFCISRFFFFDLIGLFEKKR